MAKDMGVICEKRIVVEIEEQRSAALAILDRVGIPIESVKVLTQTDYSAQLETDAHPQRRQVYGDFTQLAEESTALVTQLAADDFTFHPEDISQKLIMRHSVVFESTKTLNLALETGFIELDEVTDALKRREAAPHYDLPLSVQLALLMG